ncbi:MAG: LPS export ABC transporter periplasmic protein LptC [Thermodesulfobacteriota bacterium]
MNLSHLNRSRLIRFALSGIIFLGLAGVVAIFIDYRASNPDKTEALKPQGKADISLTEIRHTAMKDGKKEWTLTAKSAHLVDRKNKTYVESPSIIFFLDNGEEVLLTARQGVLAVDSNNITVEGDVEIKHKDYVLNAHKLYYIHDKRLIFSKLPVEIRGKIFHLVADRMTHDLNTSRSVFDGNVKGFYHEKVPM